VRELINEGDHIHVADDGGWYKGPGVVAMGQGMEYFAGSLQPAQKMKDIVSPVPVMRQVVREETSGGPGIQMDSTSPPIQQPMPTGSRAKSSEA